MRNADLRRERAGFVKFAGGETRARTRHGQRAIAERKMGGHCHDAAIDTGRERDDATLVRTERGKELVADGGEIGMQTRDWGLGVRDWRITEWTGYSISPIPNPEPPTPESYLRF